MPAFRKIIHDPLYIFVLALLKLRPFRLLDDESYLKAMYQLHFKKRLNLNAPKTYNEKLQWLKLHDRNPHYILLVDKYRVKEWVARRIGSEYVVPTYGSWDKVDDIDFDSLPNRFVLKTNHDCGGIVICNDRSSFDYEAAKRKLKEHQNRDFYYEWREWPYRDVSRLVFAEEYLEDAASGELPDYKFFCFNGVAKLMFIATERMSISAETKFDFFDMQFKHLPFTNGHPNSRLPIEKPKNFELMIALAERLSEGIPHVRVDFYEAGGRLYFGEMTFYHWSGMVPFDPEEWDETLGSWIDLSTVEE